MYTEKLRNPVQPQPQYKTESLNEIWSSVTPITVPRASYDVNTPLSNYV